MANEVVINVVSENHVKPGFDAAQADARKAAASIEKDFKESGKRSGKALSEGISGGAGGIGDGFKKAGISAGKDLSTGILGQLKAVAPSGMQALIGIGVMAAPFLGAVISGAVIGGAGIGGVVGGAIIAAHDPQVKRAFNSLQHEIGESLRLDAEPMVKPLRGAIETIKESFRSLNPVLSNIFENSADFVGPLVSGITRAVEGILKGVDDLVENAGPTMAAFGELFGDVGESIGGLFTTISENSDDATDAIQDLGSVLTFLIDTVGATIGGLTQLYGAFNDTGAAIVDMERSIGRLPEEQSELGTFMRHTAAAARDQAGAFRELADEMQAQTDPLFALIKGQKDVKTAQDKYNSALDKHGKKSREAKEAMADLGEKAFALNGLIGKAAGGFNGRLTPAMKTALRNAGLTAGQIRKLEGQLRSAADAANAWSGTFRQTYITSFKTFGKPYSQDGIDRGQVGGLATGGIKGAANGSTSSGLTWVGENGPELVSMAAGTRVHSAVDSARLTSPGHVGNTPYHGGHDIGRMPVMNPGWKPGMPTIPRSGGGGGSSSGGSSGGDGSPIVITLNLDGRQLVMAMVDPMRNFVRTSFGGNVQAAYGKG